MDLSIEDVARMLHVSESTVYDYIASGRLASKRKGWRLVVEEAAVAEFRASEREAPPPPAPPEKPVHEPFSSELLQPVLEQLAALQDRMEDAWDLLSKNQRLIQEVRQREKELAEKDIEIEKLQRDLVYQKRLFDKEIEDRQKAFEDKWAVMEKESRERAAAERAHFEEQLVLVEKHGAEKLGREQELFAQKLVEARRRESFWSKLVKMMTWS